MGEREPTPEERADRLHSSDCSHNTPDTAYLYPTAAHCPECCAAEIRAAVEAERERCAKRYERMPTRFFTLMDSRCRKLAVAHFDAVADAIRAKKNEG